MPGDELLSAITWEPAVEKVTSEVKTLAEIKKAATKKIRKGWLPKDIRVARGKPPERWGRAEDEEKWDISKRKGPSR